MSTWTPELVAAACVERRIGDGDPGELVHLLKLFVCHPPGMVRTWMVYVPAPVGADHRQIATEAAGYLSADGIGVADAHALEQAQRRRDMWGRGPQLKV